MPNGVPFTCMGVWRVPDQVRKENLDCHEPRRRKRGMPYTWHTITAAARSWWSAVNAIVEDARLEAVARYADRQGGHLIAPLYTAGPSGARPAD